jgi:4-alpha-glucanotransferase
MPSQKKQQRYIHERGAGILLHITSLPSAYGIGDVGPAARNFADFLHAGKQKYWQLLPLNPTDENAGHSPYSSMSSMASNTLLISVDDLAEGDLLSKEDLKNHSRPSTDKVNYREAEKIKSKLLALAYQNFTAGKFPTHAFDRFCENESYWLDDYVTYCLLKVHHEQKGWSEWPDEFRKRDSKKLAAFKSENIDTFRFLQWKQFIFNQQWTRLKQHCHSLNIKLFGDLPFYVSHDSVDVWTSPEIFSLDKRGSMYTSAGVPPDYFNDDGQHWGMPVYRWDALKENNYAWWMQRLQRNMKYFDLLRLDHFRAFVDYWEVSAKEKTAKKGQWKPGPGASFFQAVQKQFKTLPFVAEDLGDINESVYKLRDDFQLPGMVVLQFAFGDNMAQSDYIPHHHVSNSIVYTGTHDNNTTLGWMRKDADRATLKRLVNYTQRDVYPENVHDIFAHMAYGSVSNTVILPMQDVLGLNEKSRMNTPASTTENWLWRMDKDALSKKIAKKLANWVETYGR